MTSIAPIYLSYYVLIDCCIPTYTYAKLIKTSFFLGQILNPKMAFFFGRREYEFRMIVSHKSNVFKMIASHKPNVFRMIVKLCIHSLQMATAP
jgi:hypothetical protein